MKDLREQDPPLKPFHEWYQEDKSIYGRIGLGYVAQRLFERLVWYADYDNLLYVAILLRYDLSSNYAKSK